MNYDTFLEKALPKNVRIYSNVTELLASILNFDVICNFCGWQQCAKFLATFSLSPSYSEMKTLLTQIASGSNIIVEILFET